MAFINGSINFNNEFHPSIALCSAIGTYIILAVFWAWLAVGIWRSAKQYRKTKLFWGDLTQFSVVIGILVALGVFAQYGAPQIAELFDIYRGGARAGTPAFQPSATIAANISNDIDEYGNHYLALDGRIVPGDPELFAAAILEATSAVTGSMHYVSTPPAVPFGKPWPWP